VNVTSLLDFAQIKKTMIPFGGPTGANFFAAACFQLHLSSTSRELPEYDFIEGLVTQ
jgi:hypothetical protein